MKKFVIAVCCFTALNANTQENETITEEKASGWIKITAPPAAKKTNTVTQKKPATKKPATNPQPAPPKDFNQTNSKVNRFKKDKKD